MEPSRTPFGRCATAVLAAALLPPCAFALNPSLDISQYAHTPSKIDEGFSKLAVYSIAQTPDGYLWLGTEYGLLRFDGERMVHWPIDDSLPSTQLRTVFAARDGTLWLGCSKGLASMEAGSLHLKTYPEVSGEMIFGLAEDRAGKVWTAAWSATKATVCSVRKGDSHCYGEDGNAGAAT